MYQYTEHDRRFLDQRIVQFRHQLERRLDGRLGEDQFRPLRLQNGLYQEKHAPMLRVAIPYGELSAVQLRCLARVARRFDRGYGHFTTRQNLQFNWPRMEAVPDLLRELAGCDMHAVQTSGNVIRNITTDYLAAIAPDELVDPRPYCELIRQWSAAHPEFSWLPRKFKIAVTGARQDRAAIQVHDIGLRLYRDADQAVAIEVWVGGGLGRTPLLAQRLRADLRPRDLLSYLEAILRVYNLEARRDKLYKSRIKILVQSLGIERFRKAVDTEWHQLRDGVLRLPEDAAEQLAGRFDDPELDPAPAPASPGDRADPAFVAWSRHNVLGHRAAGYAAVIVSLKRPGQEPGNLSADGMQVLADLSERYSHGRIRTTQTQNLLLPYVRQSDLIELWRALEALGLARPNHGQASDLVCCPGADYCSLANAGTLAVAEGIRAEIEALGLEPLLGPLRINLSGCMNACGHHHIGDIGLLGVEKNGRDWYQITLAGHGGNAASLGQRLGPAVPAEAVGDAVRGLLRTFLNQRRNDETLRETLARVGLNPFRESVYAPATSPALENQPLAARAG